MAAHNAHKHPIMIKHPGALTARAKAAHETLSQYENSPHRSEAIKKEVQFAKNAKHFHHGK